MFRFQHIEFVYLFVLIPLLILVFYFYNKKRKKQWSQVNSLQVLDRFTFGDLSVPIWKIIIPITVLLLSVIAIINPQWSNQKAKVEIESSDVFIAMDISRSMLANDIRPSRLERAKLLAADIIKKLEGNRIGLILFAGEAYMHMPLTTDIGATISFLESANPNQAPTQGTAIASSIELAMQSFSEDREVGKSIIILSDGEDHEAELEDQLDKANEENIGIFTIAVGTEKGGYLPGERDNYLFDENGQVVKSTVNTEMLRDIAKSTNANFFDLSKESNIDKAILNNINQLEKHLTEEIVGTKFKSYFQFFLFPVLLWLLFTMFKTMKKSKSSNITKTLTLLFFVLSTNIVAAQYSYPDWYEGNIYYELGDYKKAVQSYKAATNTELRFETLFNLGNALYMNESMKDADKAYRMALDYTDNDVYRAKTHYNLGNVYLDLKKPTKENIEKAIIEYKLALGYDLNNIKAQGNLYLAQTVLNLLEEQEKKQQKQQQNQDNQQEKDQNQEQEKNQDQKDQNQQQKQDDQKDQQKNESDQKDGDQKEQKDKSDEGDQKNDQNKNSKEQKNQSSQDGKMTKRKVSKQEIENILKMVAEQDKNIQGKLRKTQKSKNTTKSKKKW